MAGDLPSAPDGHPGRAVLMAPGTRGIASLVAAVGVPLACVLVFPHDMERPMIPGLIMLVGIAVIAVVGRLLPALLGATLATVTIEVAFLAPRGTFDVATGDDRALALLYGLTTFAFAIGLSVAMVVVEQRAADRERLGRALDAERRTVEALQRAILPARWRAFEGVTIATRYTVGGASGPVGGDWYAVVPLPYGRVGIAMGDVAGHGIGAVAKMAEARFSLRAIAAEGEDPARVLAAANRALNLFHVDDTMITALYGIVDPLGGSFTYASAGHPPPLLIRAAGGAELLSGCEGIPIGVLDDPQYLAQSVRLHGGDSVVLYTDGLIERRGESLAEGLGRLTRLAAVCDGDAQQLCDTLATLAPDPPTDDVAILVTQLQAGTADAQPAPSRVEREPDRLPPVMRPAAPSV